VPTKLDGVQSFDAHSDISNCFYACYNTNGCEFYSYSRTSSVCKLHATCDDYSPGSEVQVEEDRWVYMMDGTYGYTRSSALAWQCHLSYDPH
jgi:hypothetical protein